MRPYGPTTEQRHEPLGLGERRPRLSWKLTSERRGAARTAFRVTAAERVEDLDDPGRLCWNSGEREPGSGLLVPWDGPALRSGTRYHWRVEVRDETGAWSGAAQTWFETGLLHGRADLAHSLLHQDRFPSRGHSIRHGATTIWERWDGWTTDRGFQAAAMNSFNHYSLGSVGDRLFGRVAGIDQTAASVAYEELVLRPLPGGRHRWARAVCGSRPVDTPSPPP